MPSTGMSLGAALAVLILWPGTARSQYNITTLLLDGAKIPGSTTGSTWYVNAGNFPSLPLSTDGAHVAFVQCGSPSNGCGPDSPDDGVWVEDIATKAFTHLVKPGDPVPVSGGVSGLSFTTFGGYALIAGGKVVFLAPDGPANGLYSVNITGTPVVKPIATQSMNLPGLGIGAQLSFGNITQFLPQSDGSLVVFFASSSAGDAVYSASLNGSNLTEVAGPNTPVGTPINCGGPINTFPEARVFDSNITMLGGTNGGLLFIFVTPLTGIPLGPMCGTNGYIDYGPLVSYNTALPDPGVFIDYATLITLDDQNVYFNAAGDGSAGVYQMPLSGNQQPTTILGANQSLPGIGPPYQSLGASLGLAADKDTLIFNAGGFSAPGVAAGGMFAYSAGNIVRIAGTGDILNGAPGNNWVPPVGPNSIATNGKVVFSFGNPSQQGVYLATPGACATDVTGELQITQAPPRLNPNTGDYNSKVTIKNTGAQAVPGPVSAVFDGLVNGVTDYGTQPPELLNKGAGATTCLSPLGEAYLVVNGGAALAAGAETTVELNIADAAGVPAFTTRVVSGTPR
jgi:hypothetical protein